MKKAVSDTKTSEILRKFSPEMGGVFSVADLHNIIGAGNRLANQRAISRLERESLIIRCQRGFYVTKDFNLWLLAARLQKNGYVSMDSVLSANGLLGTVLSRHVSMVSPRRAKSITVAGHRVDFYQASQNLYFGFSLKKGVLVADNEKAFLDLLYYYLRGYKFAIDPLSEVELERLDRKKLMTYLKKYKNSKFVAFVKGVIDDRR